MARDRRGNFTFGYSVHDTPAENMSEVLERAVLRAAIVAKQASSVTAWLVTDTNDQLDSQQFIDVFGDAGIRNMKADRPGLYRGFEVKHASLQTLPRTGFNAPVVAAYPSSRLLNAIDDSVSGWTSVIHLPWQPKDGEAWVETWGPENLLNPEKSKPYLLIEDEIVRAATLDLISNYTGLSHSSDEKLAKSIYQRLRKNGHVIVPSAIRAFAIRESGWSTGNATLLAKASGGK